MPSPIDTSPEVFRQLAEEALRIIEDFYAQLPHAPVMPVTSAQAVRDLLAEPLPEQPAAASEVLAAVRDIVYPLSRHNGHPRFFGYVASPGTAAAAIGDLLASALNANVTSWRSAPAAAEMEHMVIGWLKQITGFAPEGTGLLVSGGSMANFSALAAARTKADPHAGRRGTGHAPDLRIYASTEVHFSIVKGARLLGIGSDNVVLVPTDAAFRMDVAELERRIESDRAAGLRPMCIVANAGAVNTGAFDPLPEIAAIAERHRLWLHVDGAYGGFSALAPSAKPLFTGIDRADSLSLDPHKWLYSSVGCGCLLYREAQPAIATFSHDADYTRPVGLSNDEAFAFWDLGPELSRPFRALPLWLQLKLYGAANLADAVARNIACAQYFADLVTEAPDFELLAPVGLSIFNFRYAPPHYAGDLDPLNEQILLALQRGGSSYLSNTRIHGKFALRGCVLNYRTTEADMRRLLEDLRDAARYCFLRAG
ncbi:MAG: aminotransferase class I/II-fold pyridoxal phosphate-dependent enzyme [Bryobacterales bacterium]|nr:aminotransferase class I/II-fold pyridoxal phosphate-dependent enzyme [Bryobacterales bacterium]